MGKASAMKASAMKAVKKSSSMKKAMKTSAMKERAPNEYFKLMNEARTAGKKSFVYKGNTYVGKPNEKNPKMIMYKKQA